MDKYIFRNIKPGEEYQAAEIERICFPPHEACTEANMLNRIKAAADLFMVAEDTLTGRIAGFLNGMATDEEHFRDEFFTDALLNNPQGRNIMLLGLDVLPEYRMQGIATELMRRYAQREAARGRKKLILTCAEEKVKMYVKMGYRDNGPADSCWGGETWHEMVYTI